MTNPLDGFEFRFLDFKGLSGQSDEWISFDRTTLIVGRNNVGKSALVHALRFAVDPKEQFNIEWHRHGQNARYQIKQSLNERDLRQVFRDNTNGGPINGNHWDMGSRLIDQPVSREFDAQRGQRWLDGPNLDFVSPNGQAGILGEMLKTTSFPHLRVFGIGAERNVIPENQGSPSPVKPDGEGLTNLIRAFLYDTSLPMDEVEEGLLSDLNWVFQQDTQFSRIMCRQDQDGTWEIFLSTENGSAVRLSESGSSLKSIFIMLAVVRLNPLINAETDIAKSVFFVEEPENNLHPSLLRRLLDYLDNIARERGCNLIITTHSPPAIDWASRRQDISLFHVRRGEDGAIVSAVREYGATRRLLDDLDVRASEILQANGVIWVEGPTERIYLRKWIEIVSGGELIEGQHYSIMFYGGRLLSHLSCANPGEPTQFIHLLRMNRNLALLMDSDKRTSRTPLNGTKKRVISEAESVGAFIWVTEGKEIENYISDRVTSKIGQVPDEVDRFASVPETLGISDKIKLAERTVDITTEDDLDVLDLRAKVTALCGRIRMWNATA